ncbi:pimeloyl-[acyl-carrier protein] methyl ester esterase [Bacillus pakistanensis]|uniref:Pimeloyl-[acyl-carrier protein] methyl ester esterase n=1 Tax=Rossellomorea pakistanensis TaxID=992288 RepID=A0ABS2NJ51_9BACI|nr:alpha/beta hydrolase [Bacillus pakistanensis]MBM7587895.1 pimeloyl-[acyl-carrier protein] methyl ester esterase [Bacillus pakistanensis]
MSRPHLLMLPGWGMECHVFTPLIPTLSNIFQLSFLDWRGVRNENEYMKRVKNQLDSIHGPVWLLGWSLGTLSALEIACTYPTKIAGLILFGGMSRFTSNEQYPYGFNPIVVKQMKKQLQRNKGKTLTYFYKEMFSKTDKGKKHFQQFMSLVQDHFLGDDLESLSIGLGYLMNTDIRSELGKIKAKCLLIHGEDDAICLHEASTYIHKKLQVESEIYILKEAGHMPFFTETEKCAQIISRFSEGIHHHD